MNRHALRDAPRQHRAIDTAFTVYKRVFSPLLHALAPGQGGCCYQPTCSEYAALALAQHGLVKGAAMATFRVLRCNPFSRGGWDPVPPARQSNALVTQSHPSSPAAHRYDRDADISDLF